VGGRAAHYQSLVKEELVHSRIGWGRPPAGWGSPHLPGWGPLVDPGPRPLHAAWSLGRWLWPTLVVSGFLAVVAYTFAHDDPPPASRIAGCSASPWLRWWWSC
jgi:hypothetical protein